jgi:acyl-coenzyme A synthetase/AMP-(fatty) acid ligase
LANYFLAEGYSHGDVIALVLDNSIEYPCVWIALSKIGCITALINTNLRATPLLHSIKTVNAKGVITSKQILSGKEYFHLRICFFYYLFFSSNRN